MKFVMQSKSMLPSYITATRGLVFLKNNKKVFRYQFKIEKEHKYAYLNISKIAIVKPLKNHYNFKYNNNLGPLHCKIKSKRKKNFD